ncbi:MAG TPA: PrsW family glutamic-type intramembrane protease, partial [Bacteroidia bacterium]|nr:PrsW family glutamic-type intramembrane protease [Bacteroidia bacterium]
HVMLAKYSLSQTIPDYSTASFHLRLVDDPTTKYVNYLAGKIMLLGAGSSQAEDHFFSEIRNKGYKEGAYEYLAVLYDLQGRDTSLRALVYSGADKFVPDELRSRIYYQEKDLGNFYLLKFQSMFRGINSWGVAGGAAILIAWLFFLWRLTFLSKIKIRHLLVPVFIGALLAMSSWWLYAYYKHGLGFWMDGNILNDLLFCFAGIGFIEELVKLIPFLIILRFTGIIKKPIDYLVVASACGLGFAFFENLMYIANYGLDVIHSRALTSSVSHMACSAMVAYGFVLYKFRWPTRWWLIPLFFLFATAAHGFYDFWLLNEKVQSLGIITLFFYLSLILIYISFLNNALNQSAESEPQEAIAFNSQRLTSTLAGSLILLFAFEYLASCFVYGTAYGNASMTSAFLSGGYLVFFLSVRMSQIKVEPGVWNPIDFLSGLLPSQLLEGRKRTADDDEELSDEDEKGEHVTPPKP